MDGAWLLGVVLLIVTLNLLPQLFEKEKSILGTFPQEDGQPA